MKYQGRLNERIDKGQPPGLLAPEEAHQSYASAIVEERLSKLPELFKAHNVEDGNLLGLVLALATEYVPGFQLQPKVGPKEILSEIQKAEFHLDVNAIKEAKGLRSIKAAISEARKLTKWKSKFYAVTTDDSLRREFYYKADKRIVSMVKDARAYDALMKSGDL